MIFHAFKGGKTKGLLIAHTIKTKVQNFASKNI
jgi:hypothetical protein